jgi:hypothetical protein
MKTLKLLGSLTAALISISLISLPSFAADCNRPPSGSGSSWARAYEQWCRDCCGSVSGSGPRLRCNPGSNWGCRGSQGSGSPTYGSQPGYSSQPSYDYEAEHQRQLEADRQRQQELEEQRKREEEEARRRQEEFERNKRDALNSMKSTGGGELGLKGTGASGDLGLKGVDGGRQDLGLKGMGDTDPNVVDLRHLDPKKPITVDQGKLKGPAKKETAWATADCEKAEATRRRMAEGLPVQLVAIRRTEAQVSAARKDIADVTDEAKTMARDKLKDQINGYAQDLLTSTRALRAQVDALQAVGADKKTRDNLLRALHTVISSGEDLQSVQIAALAGYSAGTDFQKKMDSLTAYVVRANKLFVDSGIAEQIGETLSERAGGPLGAFAFKGATLSIDIGVLAARGKLSKDEYDRARKNLDVMKNQYQRSQSRIIELDRGMAKYCAGATRAAR